MFLDFKNKKLEIVTHEILTPKSDHLIIMLHEGLGSVKMWRDFPETLANKLKISTLCFSRFNYGDSDFHEVPYDVDFMHKEAELLASLIKQISTKKIFLLGHSDGASIALLAGLKMKNIEGIIAIAPHIFVEKMTVDSIKNTKLFFDKQTNIERLGKFHKDPKKTFKRWSDMWLSEKFKKWNIEEEIKKIEQKTCLIQGEDDQYGSSMQIIKASELIKAESEFHFIKNCKHSPHLEKKEELIKIIKNFIYSMV